MRKTKLVLLAFALVLCLSGAVAAVDQGEIDALLTDLVEANFSVSLQATNTLVEMGPEIIPYLEAIVLDEPKWDSRYKGITIIRRIGSVDGLPILLAAQNDSETRNRTYAREVIGEIATAHPQASIPAIESSIVSSNVAERSFARELLIDLGWTDQEFSEVYIKYLVAADSATRQMAVTLLGELGYGSQKYWNTVSPLLLDHDIEVQKAAVSSLLALGFSGSEVAKPIVEQVGTDAKSISEASALLSQLVFGDQSAALLLVDKVRDDSVSLAVRQAAYGALERAVPQLEWHLDRGLIAVNVNNGVYLGWRLLGTDKADLGFNVYRDGVKVNATPIVNSTNYLDPNGTLNATYVVKSVVDGVEETVSEAVTVMKQDYISIPLNIPEGERMPDGGRYSYSANDASAADLDGDGEYEVILKWDPSNAHDNAHSGYTGNVYLDAYKLDGTHMWRIDLGRNIRAGAHYTQFMVYDLDGDGKAEIACKTADGTVDGVGNVLGDPNADYRNSNGYVLAGPEFLTVFNGETGEAMETVDYKPQRGSVSSWGDNYGNRVDRFLAGIAYIDGIQPSLIMARGYYTRAVVVAYNWGDGELTEVWTMDSDDPGMSSIRGQGNHQLSIADVDGDGKDEIIYGAATIDDDGSILYVTGLGHGDALHVTDIDPNRPGLEVWAVQESSPTYGLDLRDARTGEVIWGEITNRDVGRGLSANIDPNYPGNECWASGSPLYSATGEVISNSRPSINHTVWWDGDLLRELLDHHITKWDWEAQRVITLETFPGTTTNNGTKKNPSLQADLFGDWREEVVLRTENNKELRIFTTTDVTEHRLYTLMHDRQYRVAVAWQNTAYNQPPHPSFYVGPDMEPQTFNIGLANSVLVEYVDLAVPK